MRTLDEVMASLEPKRRADIEHRIQTTLAGFELAQARKDLGLSQQTVANRIGVSQSAVSQLENTPITDNIQISTLNNYIKALGGQLQISAILPNGKKVYLA